MKNLVLGTLASHVLSLEDHVRFMTADSLNKILFFVTARQVHGYSYESSQNVSSVSLPTEGYLQGAADLPEIISAQYLFDQDGLAIASSKGDLLIWYPDQGKLECVGSVDSGFTCAEWSPDQELLVLCTGSQSFILMTKGFDPLMEHVLETTEFGEGKPVTVGWGRKETQFHGSEGKDAAKKVTPQEPSPLNRWDDGRTQVSWRGDGQFFAITSVDQASNCRKVRIFNSEGILQATNEAVQGLENCISWRPSGNLIATSQRKPNKHDIIFLERNGLQHGEFTIPAGVLELQILELAWNSTSDVLAILLCRLGSSVSDSGGFFAVQLWTTSNYHWYLKYEVRLPSLPNTSAVPCLLWDPEVSLKLHFTGPGFVYQQLHFKYEVVQSRGCSANNLAMVAVSDGAKLLLTPFREMVVPPPMSAYSLAFSAPVVLTAFGPGEFCSDLVIQSSDGRFTIARYLHSERVFTQSVAASPSGISRSACVNLLWWTENQLLCLLADEDGRFSLCRLALEFSEGNYRLLESERASVDGQVQWMFKNDDSNEVFVYKNDGAVHRVIDDGNKLALVPYDSLHALPTNLREISITRFDGKEMLLGLTDQHRLFLNEKEIASNCTSFFIHDEFLLLTTHSHALRCVYLKSLLQVSELPETCGYCFDEATRRIERGSKIVSAVRNGTAVILQMPRGNLETIHPRALIVSHLQKLLSKLEYRKAVDVMRKHRINLNLIYDHQPQLFLDNVDKFVAEINDVNHINLFLADVSPEDVTTSLYYPFYHHGEQKKERGQVKSDSGKVDKICCAVRHSLERLDSDRYLLTVLTTYARQRTPDLETVLLKIKAVKDNSSAVNQNTVTFDQALKYILYLIDVNDLFDVALGLYDFDVVLMVAQKSQKDPKEYLPFLNTFKSMAPDYQRFSIDKYLKRYKKALAHLVKCCPERLHECIEFVTEHKLYSDALKLFNRASEEYKILSLHYGKHLVAEKLYAEAGIILSRSCHHGAAIEAFKLDHDWCMALAEAKKVGSAVDISKLSRDLSDSLRRDGNFKDAAFLLEQYAQDYEEAIICLLEGHLWKEALYLVSKYDRMDIIETNLKPALFGCYENTLDKLGDMEQDFTRYQCRLRVVVAQKEKQAWEIAEGLRDETNNDLFSDTSSVTGQSVLSTSSRGSRSSGQSSKSRRKVQRKKFSLREGSKHEDFALKEALAEIVNLADKMKDDVKLLLHFLALHFYEAEAVKLQSRFSSILNFFGAHMDDVWPKPAPGGTAPPDVRYGSDSTVEGILGDKNSRPNSLPPGDDALPEPTKAVLRSSIRWKLEFAT